MLLIHLRMMQSNLKHPNDGIDPVRTAAIAAYRACSECCMSFFDKERGEGK